MANTTPKVLIVYFSRTGTTRLLAEHIARATGGDLEELHEVRSRRGVFGWLRSGYEGMYRLAASPLPLKREPRDYDLVFVGSPTWSRSLASPVRGFLERYRSILPEVALFATCQGHGATDVITQMTELLKAPPLAVLAMREREVKRSSSVQVAELTEAALRAFETRSERSTAAARAPSPTHASPGS